MSDLDGAVKIFERWLTGINRHDVGALAELMTADHAFVDSLGNRLHGPDVLEDGWRAYFAMCPDYWIRADAVMEKHNTVLAAGEAGGTIRGTSWQTPAAWMAVIRERKVAEWRVFADNKPVYEILTEIG